MVDIGEIRTLVDFGMVVVLWLVQLVIYPSFLHCDPARLVDWHRRYTNRVSWVIVPLLFAQLPLVGWLAWREPSLANAGALTAVLACWVLTFAVAVPLHRRIDAGDISQPTLERLVTVNWPRTALWTLAFILGLLG